MTSTSQHGRPALDQQHQDKGTLEQAEGLQGRPPPTFGLPPNHRIV